jgi:hypothetical protein
MIAGVTQDALTWWGVCLWVRALVYCCLQWLVVNVIACIVSGSYFAAKCWEMACARCARSAGLLMLRCARFVALVEHGSIAAFNAFGLQLMVNGTACRTRMTLIVCAKAHQQRWWHKLHAPLVTRWGD